MSDTSVNKQGLNYPMPNDITQINAYSSPIKSGRYGHKNKNDRISPGKLGDMPDWQKEYGLVENQSGRVSTSDINKNRINGSQSKKLTGIPIERGAISAIHKNHTGHSMTTTVRSSGMPRQSQGTPGFQIPRSNS